MNGTLGILNVGAGDTKLSFDPSKPEERKKAAAAVRQMLRAGFSIFINGFDAYGKDAFVRVHDFDPEACEYIIMTAPEGEEPEAPNGRSEETAHVDKRTRGYKQSRIPAAKARGVAVGRTSGG